MIKTSKITISLPREDFARIERIRKALGYERSAIIDKAIRLWLKEWEEKEAVKRYEKGYRKIPEYIREIKAIEETAAEAFAEEGWQ